MLFNDHETVAYTTRALLLRYPKKGLKGKKLIWKESLFSLLAWGSLFIQGATFTDESTAVQLFHRYFLHIKKNIKLNKLNGDADL